MKDLYDGDVTGLLSNRFQFATVWGKKEAMHVGVSTSKWSRQLQGVGVPIAPAISTE